MTPELYKMTQEEFNIYIEECIKSEMETFHPEEFESKYGEKSRYYNHKMKIYTYHENINFKDQEELIELWKKSWYKNGFEPVVLNIEDAKKSPLYEEFVEKIKYLVLQITGKPLSPYGLSCYLRWLAYSTQEDTDSFLVSDYDIINRQFTPVELCEKKDRLCFMDNLCPCLAYGNKEQYLSFCTDIINRTQADIEHIKQDYIEIQETVYHDQNFLVLNEKKLRHESIYNFCRPRQYVIPFHIMEEFIETKRDCKIIHFSHNSINKIIEKQPELKCLSHDKLRAHFINELN